MDLTRWKYRQPHWLRWPNGTRMALLALSRQTVDKLSDRGAKLCNRMPDRMSRQVVQSLLICESLVGPQLQPITRNPAVLLNMLTVAQLAKVWRTWLTVQMGSYPTSDEVSALKAELQLQLADSIALTAADAITASSCKSAGEFYQADSQAIGDRQLLYFMILKSTYEQQQHQSREGHTCINRGLLLRTAGRRPKRT